MKNILYPLKFKPIAKQKIWGGNSLQQIYRHNDPNIQQIGETWDVSAMSGNESEVINGFLANNNLAELVEVYMSDLIGDKVFQRYGTEFPLLVKLIDAAEDLSIQVHPNDEIAEKRHQGHGKTEMWYILDATPEASIILGFSEPVDKETLAKKLEDNTIETCLNKISVKPGDIFLVPAGTVHSIGKGCLILEIQQSSDLTYRLYDYNRQDINGQLRELHTEWALDAIDYEHWKAEKLTPVCQNNEICNVVDHEYFTSNQIHLTNAQEYDLASIDSFVLLSCIHGHVHCEYDDGYVTIVDGETILLPAEMNSLTLVPSVESILLETYIK